MGPGSPSTDVRNRTQMKNTTARSGKPARKLKGGHSRSIEYKIAWTDAVFCHADAALMCERPAGVFPSRRPKVVDEIELRTFPHIFLGHFCRSIVFDERDV